MHLDRILHQFLEPSHEIGRRVVEIDIVFDVPVAPDFDAAVLHHQHLPGQKLLDAAEKRLLADCVLECQIFCERASIRFDRGQKRHQRFGFRGEVKPILDDGVIERLDTKAVARAQQSAPALVPQRESKHASQLHQASRRRSGRMRRARSPCQIDS